MVVIVIGVAGAGKSTVGGQLATELGWEFLDADSFHSAANVAKMQAGIALDDADRAPWLESLRRELERATSQQRNLILACSALKQTYRNQLCSGLDARVIYLKGTPSLLRDRLAQRKGHFMTAQMLASQLGSLEEPVDADTITMSADDSPQNIVVAIRARLKLDRLR